MCSDEIMEKIGKLFDALGDVFMNVFCISALIFAAMYLKAPELVPISVAILSAYDKYLKYKRNGKPPETKAIDKGQFSLKQCLPAIAGYFLIFR